MYNERQIFFIDRFRSVNNLIAWYSIIDTHLI